jgi:hypothetical protein
VNNENLAFLENESLVRSYQCHVNLLPGERLPFSRRKRIGKLGLTRRHIFFGICHGNGGMGDGYSGTAANQDCEDRAKQRESDRMCASMPGGLTRLFESRVILYS